MLKTTGYLISTLSVILLGIATWQGTADNPTIRLCLLLGIAASILGMFCRWLSYEIEKKKDRSDEPRGVSPARTLSMSVRDREVPR